jgi:predicted HTH transcriptional regulator
MDAEELIRILRQGEGPRIEFKEDFPEKASEVAKEIAAFAKWWRCSSYGVADDGALPGGP